MLGLPRPGTGPMSPALAGGLNHWTTREVPVVNFWSWVISILRFIYYSLYYVWPWDSLVAQRVKCLPAMWETWVRSLGQEDPLEKKMATYSSILAWKISWMEKLGGLQSTGLQRVEHDWATSLPYSGKLSQILWEPLYEVGSISYKYPFIKVCQI